MEGQSARDGFHHSWNKAVHVIAARTIYTCIDEASNNDMSAINYNINVPSAQP